MARYECVQPENREPYEIGENTEPEHITNEERALARARERFNNAERMARETIAAQMRLEDTAEGWPDGHELKLWRFRYTTSCTPDGKPCWIYHTLVNMCYVGGDQLLRVLTPDGIRLTGIGAPGEFWVITVRSVADLPEEWMTKPVNHTIPLRVEEPLICDCPYCQRDPVICITDTIEEGHTLVSEAMRKILDEIDG